MKVRKNVLISIVLMLVLGATQFATPSAAFAAGTVGGGTPASCTEAALDSALLGGGSVTFSCGVSPMTITITSTKVISSNTQINGGGLITISGGNLVRVFTVNSGISLTLTGITIADGYNTADGGGLYLDSGSSATITNSTFNSNDVVGAYGGAIYVNAATLNVTNSTFSNNSADVSTRGIYSLGGGAIQNNDGTVTITGSTFSNNTVISDSGDGGAIYNGDFDAGTAPDGITDTLIISNSTFYNNTLVGDTDGSSGGAIRSNSDTTLIHNTFSNNDGGVSQNQGESGAVTFTRGNVILRNNIFANSSGTYDCAKRNEVVSLTESGNIAETHFNCGTPISTADPKLGVLQNNGGPTWTIDFTDVTAATDAVACAGGLTADQRGVLRPTGTSCDIGSLEVDRFQPTVTINQAVGQSDPANATPVNFTVVFSEAVVGFTTGDVNLSASNVGGTLIGSVTGGPTTFNVAVTGMTTQGDIIATIDAAAATDIALNTNVASTSTDNTVSYDGTGPTVAIEKAAAQDDPTNNAPINFEVVFSESVTGFAASDVTIGGTANPTTKNVSGSGTTYNVAVGGFGGSGTVTATVNAGAVSDALGNPSSASTTASVTYDATAPTVSSITRVGTNPTNAASVNFLVTFSESVTGGATSNFSLTTAGVTGASISGVTGSGATRTVSVSTGTGTGTIELNMANNTGVADAAGNVVSGLPFNTGESYSMDRTAPTVSSITRVGSSPTNAASVQFLVTFSESVTGGGTSNFSLNVSGVSGASVSSVTGSGTTRTVTVNTGTGSGSIRLDMANSTGVADGVGNAVGSLPFETGEVYSIDKAGPTVTINQAAAQSDPTNASTINFTVVFGESVSNFATGDVSLSGTANATTATVTGSGTTYNIAVSGMTQTGTVTATVAAGVATDASGNNNAASTSTDNTVQYDTDGPTVTVNQAAGQADPTGLTPGNFTVVFSNPVVGFGSSDVNVAGTAAGVKTATVTEIAPNDDTTYNVAITGMTSSGTVIVSIPAGTILDTDGNPNFASTSTDNTITFNFVKPGVPVLTAPLSGGTVSGLQPLLDWNASSPVAQFYQIQISKVGTFTSTVTDQSNITDTQFTPASALDPGVTYYWRVRAYNAIGLISNWSAARNFKTPLQAPVANSPIGGVVLTTDRPTFEWTAVPGATSYSLQISTVSNFASIASSSNTISSPFTVFGDLAQNTVFYWRVQAKTATVTSAWSTVQSFKTGNPPTVPVLVTPISNVLTTDYTPLFNWNDSTVPAGVSFRYYEIQVDESSNFTNPLALQGTTTLNTITNSQYVDEGTPLNPGTPYYWRVRSVSSYLGVDQFSAWSTVATFRTAIVKPVLETPANAAALATLRPSFDWQDVPGATGYQFAISRFSNMSTALVNATLGATSSYTSTIDLPANTTLYWRVRATGPFGPSLWSDIRSFKTGNPPTVPALVAPISSVLVTDLTPLFNWSDSTVSGGATFSYYEIEVDESSNFNTALALHGTTTAGVITLSQYNDELTPLNPGVTYYWRVRAVSSYFGVDQVGGWSKTGIFRTAVNKPVLTSPSNAAVLGTLRPSFDWEDVTGAAGYQISISRFSTMASPLLNATVGASSSYTVAVDLPVNTTLYWYVRATGSYGPSLWSDVRSFKTGNPPSMPLLSAPAINALNTNYLPLFDWTNSTVPAGTFKYYEIEVDDNSNFQSTAFTRTTTLNVVTASQYQTQAGTDLLNPNTKYYWRVRSVSTISGVDHFSNWSVVRYFRTALTPPASLTVTPSVSNPPKPLFDWADVTGATTYTIQVSLNANFGSPIVNATIGTSSYTPAINLPLNTLLYWRVRANGTNTSAWSSSTYTIAP